jgi:hypothetical protein
MFLPCLDIENRYLRKWIVGSNPTPSVNIFWDSNAAERRPEREEKQPRRGCVSEAAGPEDEERGCIANHLRANPTPSVVFSEGF